MPETTRNLLGARWRSSSTFIVLVISIAMFSDTFLFSFIIPMLPAILQDQMEISPSNKQILTSVILSMNALVSVVLGPITGYMSDKLRRKNRLMTVSWAINIIGTAITAYCNSLPGLFLGRLIQTIAGSFIWIVGMAVIGQAVGPSNLAKALGFVTLFVSGGLLSGPAVSGSMYNFVSYSMTWVSAFGVLALGIILQLLVVETDKDYRDLDDQNTSTGDGILSRDLQQSHDSDPLLPSLVQRSSCHYHAIPGNDSSNLPINAPAKVMEVSTKRLWWMLLSKSRVLTALVADALFAIIIASFETTIPIHIKAVFHWDTLQAGLLFLLVQAPSLILVIPTGWLKDKIGMRYPVAIGYLLLAPSLWLLGAPGHHEFKWANRGNAGQIIYIVTLLSIGVWRTLPLGFGAIEVLAGVNEITKKQPGIFGQNGGFSRAFTLSNISWKFAMFLGPLISGGLSELFGYYYLNFFLAILCVTIGIATFIVLGAN